MVVQRFGHGKCDLVESFSAVPILIVVFLTLA